MMKLWMTVDVADQQRVLLWRRGRYEKLLLPGRHRVSLLRGNVTLERYHTSDLVMARADIKYLMREHAALQEHLVRYATGDTQVALVYRDGKLMDLLPPASELVLWRHVDELHVELIDIAQDMALPAALLGPLCKSLNVSLLQKARALVYSVDVPVRHVGLLRVNGGLQAVLEAGSYGYWQVGRSVDVTLVDLRVTETEVSGQEILTRDRVSLRLNLSASYQVTDVRKLASMLKDAAAYTYRVLQLALREAVGTRSLDELLEQKDALNGALLASARDALADVGIGLLSVGVKDIILPGEMKEILNQVVQAQKEAEANLIRRREETQAMRSLHNTAKMMENSPVLMRLKELEALERVTGRIDRISVYGGLDGLMNELVKLRSVAG